MELLELTADNFDQQIDLNPFMVIDFWAPWCAPCLSFERICADLSSETPDVRFARINIDEQPALAEDFAITSVPFVLIMRNRVILHTESGLLSKAALQKLIAQARKQDLPATA
jgi:thioredoxin 1